MEEPMSSEKLGPVTEPFANCYDDPIFELDENGEIVGYIENPEDWVFESMHIVGL